MVIIIIFAVALLLLKFVSILTAFLVFRPKKWGYDQSRAVEIERGRFNPVETAELNILDVYTKSSGLKLHGHLINRKKDRTIIFMHGHCFTLFGSYKYMKIFLDRGFNVLMPDQRYHGLSEGKNCTLGYEESNDLHRWIEFIKTEIPETEIIGLHGESMGAATVLLGGHHKAVDFVISDCSFSELKVQVADVLRKRFKIPGFIVYPAHLFSLLLFNAPLLRINPADSVQNIKAPILFIHGESDSYVPVKHLNKLTEHKKGVDSVYICRGADHAKSFETNPLEYERIVDDFINSCGLK